MKRILVHIPMTPYGEYDIFREPNNGELLRVVREQYHGTCPNIGNRLWFQGIISEISTPENELEYFSPDMTKEYINSRYDMIIAPMANVFSMAYQPLLESLAERFRGIQIPVYVIACGVQADSFDRLDELCGVLKPAASAFISSVYNTGGEFALRGYFTKEFFERLGFSSAVVTGCPSLYQLGRDLRISEEKKDREQFRAVLNGKPADYQDLLDNEKHAEFFDQNTYFHELWNPEYYGVRDCLKRMVKKYGYDTTAWLLEDRIKLIPHMNTWRQYLLHGNFAMSYGSRIHGSIMPILAGIPAVLECRDARTREMADFFGIPCVEPGAYRKAGSLYELYETMDYGKFNGGFSARYDAFEAFLQQCGIVERINGDNLFFRDLDDIPIQSSTCEERAHLLRKLEKNKTRWKCYDSLLRLKRSVIAK